MRGPDFATGEGAGRMRAYQRLGQELSAHLPRGGSRQVTAKAALAAAAGLPLANPAQALREIAQLLDAMLATAWRGGERAALLARLRAPAASLCRGTAQALLSERHPLAPAAAEQAAVAQQLAWKLACNDALALHELCGPGGKVPRFGGRAPAAAACAAGLCHGGHVLMWAYRQYRAPPAGAWRFMHALHAAADELGLAMQSVDDPCFDGGPTAAREVYAQALLLALANPYRFSAPELQEARAVTACLADKCRLAPTGAEGFAIDAASDAGPGYVASERPAPAAGSLVLDLKDVVRAIDECIGGSTDPEGGVELHRAGGGGGVATRAGFLRRLASGWTALPRGHGRLPASHGLDVAFGMHAAHYLLAGNQDFAAFIARVEGDASGLPLHESATAWPATREAARPQPLRADVLDQSEGGYRLRLQEVDGQRARIGEVVALTPAAEDPEEREWMVGMVRWLRLEDGHARMGIQLLQRSARAAALRPLLASDGAAAPLRAVDVSDGTDAGQLLLLLSHVVAPGVAAAEVALPALPADWTSRATVATWRVAGTEALGAACFRVKLERTRSNDESLGEHDSGTRDAR